MKQQFHHGLNGLRGLACVTVVIFHCCLVFRLYGLDHADTLPLNFPNPHVAMLHVAIAIFNGPACVILFFILSGLVLALSLDKGKPLSGRVFLAYWIRRLFRLYPLLLLATAFALGLQLIFHGTTFATATTWLNNAYNVDLNTKDILRNFVGTSSSLNSPAWSIKVEIIESLLFPALYMLARSKVSSIVTLLLLVTLTLSSRHTGTTLDALRQFTVCFFIGALIPRWRGAFAAAFTRPILVGAVIVFCMGIWVRHSVWNELIEVSSAAFIIAISYHHTSGKLARSVVATRLGEISYSIYLLHMPVLLTIIHIWLSIDQQTVNWLAGTILLAFCTLSATIPLAWLSYRYFELPLEGLGRRIAKRVNPTSIRALVRQNALAHSAEA